MFIQTPTGKLVNLAQINEVVVEQTFLDEYAVTAYGMPTSSEDYQVAIRLLKSDWESCEMYLKNLCETLGAIDTAGYEQPMAEPEPEEKQGFLEANWDNELPF